MKQIFKRSTAWLLCLAMLLSLVGGIPGSFISKVSAAETESTETTDELSGSYCFTFDGATDLDSLFADGWKAINGSTNIRKAFFVDEENGNKVLKWDNSSNNTDRPPAGAYGIGTPLVRVTPGATVVANAEMKTPSGKTAMMWLYFYDANGDELSPGYNSGSKDTAGAWGVYTVSAVAPSEAAYARAVAYNGTSCDDVCYFDNIIVREQITTVSANGFAEGKTTSKWSSIDIDFEGLHSLNGIVNLGWTPAGGTPYGTYHELVEEADGNKALRMIGKSVYSPLVDVRDMTAIRAMMEVKGNTAMTLYTYFFDENGDTTLSEIGVNDESTTSMGVQDATKWLRYSSKNIALPDDTAYVMFMLYATSTTDLLIDNFKVIDANEDHNKLNYDFENDTKYSLYYDGWTHSSTTYNGSISVVADPDNAENYVMQLQKPSNLAEGSVVNIYSPYVKVDGLSTIRVSAEGKTTEGGNTMLYVYFYQADRSTEVSAVSGQTTIMNLASKNSIDLTVPDGAVYANIRIDNGKSYVASYYDNISITCVHTYESAVTKAATCTEKGVTTYTCSDCGDTYPEEISMIDHTYTTKPSGTLATPADCDNAATYYVQCDNCDEVTTEKTVAVGEALTAVAQVGEKRYATLAEAVAAANGGTVTLLDSITLTETVTITGSMTLDLAGKTITAADCTAVQIWGDGIAVTITGNGTITSNTNAIHVVDGTVTIENGTYTSTCATGGFVNAALYVGNEEEGNDGVAIINGGTFNGSTGYAYALRCCDGILTLNAGTINGANLACCTGVMNIKGGTFSSNDVWSETEKDILFVENPDCNCGIGKVVVTGGTFNGQNPANASISDDATTSYVAEGYTVEENNGVYTVVALKENVATNTRFDEELSLIVYYQFETNPNNAGYVAKLVKGGVTIDLTNWAIDSDGDWAVELKGISAKEIADVYTITIYDGENAISKTQEVSLRAYAIAKLESENTSAVYKTAMIDMLNYAAAAQAKYGYNTENLANAGLEDYQGLATQTMQSVTNERDTEIGEVFDGSNVRFNDAINILFYFKGISLDTYAEFSWTNNKGEPCTYIVESKDYQLDGESYVVELDGQLDVADARCKITCTIKNADGTTVIAVVDSVSSNVARVLAKEGSTYKALYESFMKYADATKAYLDNKNQ